MQKLSFSNTPQFFASLGKFCASVIESANVSDCVSAVLSEVKAHGDKAVFEYTQQFDGAKLKAWTKRHKEYLSYLKPEQLKQWKQQYEEEFEYQTITNQTLSDIQRAIDKTKGQRRKELFKKYKEIIEMEELTDELKAEQAKLRLQHWQENKTNRLHTRISESTSNLKKRKPQKYEETRQFLIPTVRHRVQADSFF